MSKSGEFGIKTDSHINELTKPGSFVLTLVSVVLLLPWISQDAFHWFWKPLLVLSLAVNGFRLLLAMRYPPAPENLTRWRTVFILTTYSQAILWGLAAAILIQDETAGWTRLFAILVTAAMAAGSQGTLAPSRRFQQAYLVCSLGPGFLAGLWRADGAGISLALLFAGYAAFLWAHGSQAHRLLLDNWRKEKSLSQAARDLQEANTRMTEAAEAKSRLLADMSHEIRTPMNGILGMGELLAAGKLSPEQADMVSALRHSGEHLMGLLNDILDLSKAEAGKMAFESAPLDLRSLLDEVARLYRVQAVEKGVDLSFHWDETLTAHRLGDAMRLRQVFNNLVHNAVKFTSEGRIEIAAVAMDAARPAHIRVDIRDTGIGIAPDFQARLFESYAQPDASWSRRFGGSGLGLTIARALVQAMGGTLSLDSSLGIGTRFSVTLDLPVAPEAPPPDAASEPGAFLGRVLVAEDNPVNRRVVEAMLDSLGLEVALVENGLDAHERATRDRFDLVFMDCQMPGMDGLEATRRIRKAEAPFSQVPIVALTANAMVGDREKCLAAGMDDYMAKPINLRHLRTMVRRWLPEGETGQVKGEEATPTLV